ncbi:MAG: hypothetical protein J1D85_04720 [Bacteroidales bacterium]|nr:hypothetical protein [Bacteroidales bacterium]
MVRELVREHDSLSLPGLGTFEVEDVPAAFSDRGYTVNPPYRSLSFSGKKTDDGLLAGLYARDNESVSISDADGIIRNFVAGLADTLRADKYVELPGLGRLRATKENVPFFVPDDGLDISPESCGLPQVSLRTRRSADLPPLPFVSDGASPERASSAILPADVPIAAAQVVAAPDAAESIAAVPVVAAPIAAAADAAASEALKPIAAAEAVAPIAAEPATAVLDTAVPVAPDVAAPIAAVQVAAVPDVAAPVSAEPVAAAHDAVAPNVAVPAAVASDAVAADSQEHASASSVHAAAVDGLSVGADSASESVLEDAASEPVASSRDESPEDSTEKVSSASGSGMHPLLRTVLLLIAAALVILAVFTAVSRIFPGSTDFLLYSPEELEILNYPENGIGLPG